MSCNDPRDEGIADAPRGKANGKKRKQRPHLNCAECRRLKLRCDRSIPCTNCVKRSCQQLCPNGARDGPRSERKRRRTSSVLDHDNPVGRDSGHPVQITAPDRRLSVTSTLSAKSAGSGRKSSHTGSPLAAPFVAVDLSTGLDPTQSFELDSLTTNHQTADSAIVFAQVGSHASVSGRYPMSDRQSSSMISMGPPTVPVNRTPTFDESASSPSATQSHGTLVISHTGSSKYLGPSAASEWLKDAEVLEASETPGISRATSPIPASSGPAFDSHGPSVFPFAVRPSRPGSSLSQLLKSLPAIEEAEALVESYHRYFGWSYEIASRGALQRIMNNIYASRQGEGMATPVDPQQLGLIFIVLAMGALHNLELPPDDTSAEEYLVCSEDCLARGRFMTNNTMAGVQTLTVMAHFHLETDKGRNGDSAWALWGLAMRLIQARWNLPPNVIEDRRRLFWESHSAEVFQANCFSRPYTIPSNFVDTRLPKDSVDQGFSSYHTLKFELSKIAKDVLHAALSVETPPYSSILSLYERLHLFERSIPFQLRCRTALLALPSLYSDASIAEAESPELNKRDLRRTFEQFSISMMVSETIVNLYRPYFMRALIESPSDPLRSEFGQAYLSVVERSNAIIQIVCGLYALHASVTARHWWSWYHAFNSAVCLGTLILMCPKNELVPIALGAIDQVIGIYTDIVHSRSAPRLVQNLRWLLRLRQRVVVRVEQATNQHQGEQGQGPDSDTETDAGLLGWRTRLIKRAARGRQKATSISTKSPNSSSLAAPGDLETVIRSIPQAIQEHIASGLPQSGGSDTNSPSSQMTSTDQLLHSFWDPMMSNQDTTAAQNPQLSWWDLVSQPPPHDSSTSGGIQQD